jgi:periplasmic protein TonB
MFFDDGETPVTPDYLSERQNAVSQDPAVKAELNTYLQTLVDQFVAMQEAEEARKQPPEEEKPTEKLEQQPLPPQQDEIALPQVQEKEIEPKPVVQPPAPETRAPPKTERVGQFTEASANAYNALVFGHIQRFKRYPASARGASGTVMVRFELNRAGGVIGSAVTKSSGNAALDQEALDLLRRASPFPPFPAAKPGEKDSYIAPVNFSR